MLYVVMVPHLTFKYIVYLFPTKVASRLFCLVCAHCCVGHLKHFTLRAEDYYITLPQREFLLMQEDVCA